MRLKIKSLTIRSVPEDGPDHPVDDHMIRHHRTVFGGVQLLPGQEIVVADLVRAEIHDCEFMVEVPLSELPEHSTLGSELELEFKLIK
jgi:hypothetical protein